MPRTAGKVHMEKVLMNLPTAKGIKNIVCVTLVWYVCVSSVGACECFVCVLHNLKRRGLAKYRRIIVFAGLLRSQLSLVIVLKP